MQSRLPAGKLKNLDAAFAIEHALDAALEIGERDGIDVLAGADRGIGVAGGAGEIARVHDLDERETGGEFLERRVTFSVRVPPEGAAHRAVAGAAGVASAAIAALA